MMMIEPPSRSAGPADDLHHRRSLFGRQAGAGLVEQQDARLGQKRHRKLEDLLFAVRQLRGLARARGQKRIARLQLLRASGWSSGEAADRARRACRRGRSIARRRDCRRSTAPERRWEFAACGRRPGRSRDWARGRRSSSRRDRSPPAAVASSPLTTLNIEVLPAPFGPMTQKIPAWSNRPRACRGW